MDDLRTNFDRYLERKLQDPDFRARFEAADQAWDIALTTRRPTSRAWTDPKTGR